MDINDQQNVQARKNDELSAERRAALLGFPYYDTTDSNKALYKELIPVNELKQYRIVPLVVEKGHIIFGITTTTSQQTIERLKQYFADYRTEFHIISDWGFREYMELYDPPKEVVYQDIELSDAGSDQLVERVSQMLEEIRPDDMLAYLVEQAHNLSASDIHIENQVEYVRIRFRIDGVLHSIAHLRPDRYRILQSVIASAGNVSTADPDAQQGHISQQLVMATGEQVQVNVRLETVPTINGMDVVMRLFNMNADNYVLDKLGLDQGERQVIDEIIAKPSGLVLVVGPTGSGKTTTLYSILNTLNNESRKIITIEDPVEYQFPGIVQIPVNSSAEGDDGSFATKLRAILRLDPDIVMVGEIRDNDTAKTALQASLTGHLVLATFHASSAAAAITRLEDVIGRNPLFLSAIRLVMAQRLVRRLDDSTKQAYQPTPAELAKINEILKTFPNNYPLPSLEGLSLYKPGKSASNPYGYSGQLALREQFMIDQRLRKLLENQDSGTIISAQSVEQAAIDSGMLTMLQKGILHVLAGETTLSEIYRVIG